MQAMDFFQRDENGTRYFTTVPNHYDSGQFIMSTGAACSDDISPFGSGMNCGAQFMSTALSELEDFLLSDEDTGINLDLQHQGHYSSKDMNHTDVSDMMRKGLAWAHILENIRHSDNPHMVLNSHHENQAYVSTPAAMEESDGSLTDEESLLSPKIEIELPQDVSSSSASGGRSRWLGFIWLFSACIGLTAAAAANLRSKVPQAAFKGVMTRRGKFVCEMRIMKKMQNEEGKLCKVWLGTYKTKEQARRALYVGRYFLCAKENKSSSDPGLESLLLSFRHQCMEQPLKDLVKNVKKIAKHYANHGSLQNLKL